MKRLEMSGCTNLKMLPNSIGLLAHLVELKLKGCQNLSYLWENDANIEVKELNAIKWCGIAKSLSWTSQPNVRR